MRQHIALVKFLGRRALEGPVDAVLGADVAHWRRLRKQGRVVLGPHTYGEPEVLTFSHDDTKLVAGGYCSLAGSFMLGGGHGVDTVSTYPHRINWGMEGAGQDGIPVKTADTRVGSDVWTGAKCLVLSGVSIGDGAIVAAGAVVTKDVPPYAIVGGSPARLIRYRHTEEQRAELLRIRWWDWPEEEVRAAVPYLASTDIDAFIAYAKSRGR